MVKSGLIFGGVMILGALGVTLLVPYCVPCAALLLGLAAGYAAGAFEKPGEQPRAVRAGALAGLIAGAGGVIGEMLGAVINGFTVGPERAIQILQGLGIQTGVTMTQTSYWASQVGINCCISLLSAAIMAGVGALGGLIWWSAQGKKAGMTPPLPPAGMQ